MGESHGDSILLHFSSPMLAFFAVDSTLEPAHLLLCSLITRATKMSRSLSSKSSSCRMVLNCLRAITFTLLGEKELLGGEPEEEGIELLLLACFPPLLRGERDSAFWSGGSRFESSSNSLLALLLT